MDLNQQITFYKIYKKQTEICLYALKMYVAKAPGPNCLFSHLDFSLLVFSLCFYLRCIEIILRFVRIFTIRIIALPFLQHTSGA